MGKFGIPIEDVIPCIGISRLVIKSNDDAYRRASSDLNSLRRWYVIRSRPAMLMIATRYSRVVENIFIECYVASIDVVSLLLIL